MKKFNFLWTLVALPFMASCSHDDLPNSGSDYGSEPGKDGIYMTVTLNPNGTNGTRSETIDPNDTENNPNGNLSSDGTEVGSDVENAVKSALIVIANHDNEYIAHSLVPGEDGKGGSLTKIEIEGSNLYTSTAKFDKTDISTYYNKYKSDPDITKINVFVFCNPTSDLISKMDSVSNGIYPASKKWYNAPYTVNFGTDGTAVVDGIWNPDRGFTMSNVNIAKREFPKTIDEWNKYNTPNSAFKLSGLNQPGTDESVDNLNNGRGAINVQRMAARFDFRDGSQLKDADNKPIGNGVDGEAFTYAVVNNVNGDNIVKCKLYAMGLTNMSTTQYYLGRVSPDGRLTNETLCGTETPSNYVVSTYAQEKYDIIKTDFSAYFKYPFFVQETQNGQILDPTVATKGTGWDWIQCNDVVEKSPDNYGDKSFHVWRYVTENTIPGPPDKQVNSQSTGVIFKARLLPTNNLQGSGTTKWEQELYTVLEYKNNGAVSTILNTNADTDPILYSLAGNTLYVTWENVQQAALNAAGFDETKTTQDLDRKAPLYILCYGTGGYGTITIGDKTFTDDLVEDRTSANWLWKKWEDARKVDPEHSSTIAQMARADFKKKATGLGFTLYQSSQDPSTGEWGYYCYYYYWNRHNDNHQPGAMGNMEFAVVRNNVYKLTVTRLNTLGHPRIPENDPDDPKPDTPDESSEVYMSVSVDVIPWVVRLNDIEF